MEADYTNNLKNASSAAKELRTGIKTFLGLQSVRNDPLRTEGEHASVINIAEQVGLLPVWKAVVQRWELDGI